MLEQIWMEVVPVDSISAVPLHFIFGNVEILLDESPDDSIAPRRRLVLNKYAGFMAVGAVVSRVAAAR
jgi:hypothetical protein